jgi:hypothetical protein
VKTLTELSGSLIRAAAAAITEAKRSLPEGGKPSEPDAVQAQVTSPDAASEAAPTPDSPTPDSPAGDSPAGQEPGETTAASPPSAPPEAGKAGAAAEEAESDAVRAALDAAVAAATGLSGDRLARLRDAVKAVGRRTADVRLVRVFSPEETVGGAKLIGGFQYLVDLLPASTKQAIAAPEKDRGGRGGGRRGGQGGGGRGGGGGGGGTKAGTTGGFSMDSLRDDRKGGRGAGGRPGGGKRPGGGRPPGGSK